MVRNLVKMLVGIICQDQNCNSLKIRSIHKKNDKRQILLVIVLELSFLNRIAEKNFASIPTVNQQ